MLAEARLYGILDLAYVEEGTAPAVLGQLLEGGVDVVQLRGKTRTLDELTGLAQDLQQLTSRRGIPFIINDHPRIAEGVAAEGVHVGQDDAPIAQVRAQVGRPIFVGKSTHSVAQAVAAESEGADYIGFGPLFATPTKPDYPPIGLEEIAEVHARVSVPIFCIGGIKLENLPEVMAAGAERVVIVSGLLRADNITDATRIAAHLLKRISKVQNRER